LILNKIIYINFVYTYETLFKIQYVCIYVYIYIILLYGIFKYIRVALSINSIARGSALNIFASCLLHFLRTIMMLQTKKRICMEVA